MTKIKGFFGEKTVAFILSGLDKTKYKIINNIMLQVGNRTTLIEILNDFEDIDYSLFNSFIIGVVIICIRKNALLVGQLTR
ncbi:hypothetical protein [Clostridium sp.]|uniref:hypothetical protein n=1 Tax=Clostridium sp. TaxID=1506 RepID=UPI001A54A78B|nr:hypothetical protein [Clostridium sp.]MBK5242739.1 hypothetical protein [Clostridium sp.]